MKKSTPITQERESEAFIPGNGREHEFLLTPDSNPFLPKILCMSGDGVPLIRNFS